MEKLVSFFLELYMSMSSFWLQQNAGGGSPLHSGLPRPWLMHAYCSPGCRRLQLLCIQTKCTKVWESRLPYCRHTVVCLRKVNYHGWDQNRTIPGSNLCPGPPHNVVWWAADHTVIYCINNIIINKQKCVLFYRWSTKLMVNLAKVNLHNV